jgi:hypothetical protein
MEEQPPTLVVVGLSQLLEAFKTASERLDAANKVIDVAQSWLRARKRSHQDAKKKLGTHDDERVKAVEEAKQAGNKIDVDNIGDKIDVDNIGDDEVPISNEAKEESHDEEAKARRTAMVSTVASEKEKVEQAILACDVAKEVAVQAGRVYISAKQAYKDASDADVATSTRLRTQTDFLKPSSSKSSGSSYTGPGQKSRSKKVRNKKY